MRAKQFWLMTRMFVWLPWYAADIATSFSLATYFCSVDRQLSSCMILLVQSIVNYKSYREFGVTLSVQRIQSVLFWQAQVILIYLCFSVNIISKISWVRGTSRLLLTSLCGFVKMTNTPTCRPNQSILHYATEGMLQASTLEGYATLEFCLLVITQNWPAIFKGFPNLYRLLPLLLTC